MRWSRALKPRLILTNVTVAKINEDFGGEDGEDMITFDHNVDNVSESEDDDDAVDQQKRDFDLDDLDDVSQHLLRVQKSWWQTNCCHMFIAFITIIIHNEVICYRFTSRFKAYYCCPGAGSPVRKACILASHRKNFKFFMLSSSEYKNTQLALRYQCFIVAVETYIISCLWIKYWAINNVDIFVHPGLIFLGIFTSIELSNGTILSS